MCTEFVLGSPVRDMTVLLCKVINLHNGPNQEILLSEKVFLKLVKQKSIYLLIVRFIEHIVTHFSSPS